jgi:hypothetical protein
MIVMPIRSFPWVSTPSPVERLTCLCNAHLRGDPSGGEPHAVALGSVLTPSLLSWLQPSWIKTWPLPDITACGKAASQITSLSVWEPYLQWATVSTVFCVHQLSLTSTSDSLSFYFRGHCNSPLSPLNTSYRGKMVVDYYNLRIMNFVSISNILSVDMWINFLITG